MGQRPREKAGRPPVSEVPRVRAEARRIAELVEAGRDTRRTIARISGLNLRTFYRRLDLGRRLIEADRRESV